MANKFENRIKEIFEKRTIVPSRNAWEAVESQLGQKEVGKKGRFTWYGIAAGFIGILLLSVFFVQQSKITVTDPIEVVTVPVEQKQQVLESNDPLLPAEAIVITQTAPEEKVKVPVNTRVEPLKKEPISKTETFVASLSEEKEHNNVLSTSDLKEKGIENKIAEVVAMVAIMEETNGLVGDAEVDAMLRQAQKELLAEQFIPGDTSVDAYALLVEVEDELNRSLRDQLFEKLKDGYLKVKTAVAYRNN